MKHVRLAALEEADQERVRRIRIDDNAVPVHPQKHECLPAAARERLLELSIGLTERDA